MTKTHALPVLALAAAMSILLTGCGPINAGSAAVDDFQKYMAGEPRVVDVQAGGSNDLPFQGSAQATVVLEDGADEGTLSAVVEHMAAYLRKHPGNVSWSMAATVDGFTLGVSELDATNDATIDLLGDARAIDGIVGGVVDAGTEHGDVNSLVVEDPAQFIVILEQLVTLDFPAAVEAGDAAGTFTVKSTDDVRMPEPEVAAFDAVAAEYQVTSAQLEPGAVAIRVAADDQAVAATALVESLPGSDGITFTITGGFVTREGDGDFAFVDGAIAQLITVPGVTAIEAKFDVLGLTVSTLDAVIASEAVLAEADPAGTLTVYYVAAADVSPSFRIYGPTERRGTYIPVVAGLMGGGYLDQIEILADRIDVVAGPYNEATMAEFAVTLKRLVPDGEQVRLTNSEGGVNFSFIVDDIIGIPDDESYGDVTPDAFEDAWNAAP